MDERIIKLTKLCEAIYKKENVLELFEKYSSEIKSITPKDLFLIFHGQLKKGFSSAEILTFVDKAINVFQGGLETYAWEKPKEGSFLFYLIKENAGLIKTLEDFKSVIKQNRFSKNRSRIREFIDKLYEYNEHLVKLENILFPYMEKKMERYEGLKIMWSLHDATRKSLKRSVEILENEELDEKKLKRELGSLYFKLYGLVQKQELIMFPAATEILSQDEFFSMHLQSFDYEFPYIERPKEPKGRKERQKTIIDGNDLRGLFITETGSMSLEIVEMLINALPVDLTFVDENDEVAFFSRPKERIFPRSAAVIGRDVRNCHPPESVHVVEKIIDSFKDGSKDEAKFWIQMKGMFILIQYFALRDDEGNYRGTLEVSQEVSDIRSLEGEKRLLD